MALKMRLLNTKKILVESFPSEESPEIPDYAILSHRWGKREVTFQEIQDRAPSLQGTEGYEKVLKCCELASSVGFEYIWIDTCCIDKTNQVELDETLPAMFHYYRKSQVCYTYLADVPSGDDPHEKDSKFRTSKWFTRGWTVQELVAPLYVTFFNQGWEEIGTKASLQKVVSEITGITSQILLTNYGGEISVKDRLAWAANRETYEAEDKAYCLMGLLGVSMPVRYKEGEKEAFKRLQEEIDKLADESSTDPNRFDVSSWMVPETPYIFLIRKRPAGYPSELLNEMAQWTIKEHVEEIRLQFGGSGHSGIMMFRDKRGRRFAATMGVHNYNVWCDIAVNLEDDNIKSLAKEYWEGRRSNSRWNNLDRRTISLWGGNSVSLAIRKGRVGGQKAYLIDISAGRDFWLDKVGPGC
ncbi:hypothetical protein EG329_007688 [Mollisiaceae sp. DMI_Dod_QoI]|nr:hypothetical protein EG329_007688 [Helotiales sp. DMI_Dod_QoI]